MTTRHFKVLLEWDSDSHLWVSYVPSLDHLSTFGESREQAIEHTKEAVLGYLEAAEKSGITVPAGSEETELVDVEVAIA